MEVNLQQKTDDILLRSMVSECGDMEPPHKDQPQQRPRRASIARTNRVLKLL